MANSSSNKYFIKNTASGTFVDITTMFDGLAILKVDGLLGKGEPVNIYTEQWVNEQEEDFLITNVDNGNNPVVIRKNMDIDVTFIIREKYASNAANFDARTLHDNFVAYITNTDVWIKSSYVGNKYAHCVCLKEYKPTEIKLHRSEDSYIMGTITLHCLDAPIIDS